MIHDLDNSLKMMLEENLKPTFPDVEILFSSPEMLVSISNPTVTLFLSHIEERKELRGTGEKMRKDPVDNVTYQQIAPLWMDCFYQIHCGLNESALNVAPFAEKELTIYTAEHWLLTEVIKILSRYTIIPESYLQGTLAGEKASNEILETQLFTPSSLPNTTRNITKLGMSYTVTLGLRIQEDKRLGDPIVETKVNANGI